jgi:hypothetical protein
MDFKGLLQKLAYSGTKALGNKIAPNTPVTPERKAMPINALGYFNDKQNSRGMLGDFLAEKIYQPPIQSPLPANDGLGLLKAEVPQATIPQKGLRFEDVLGAVAKPVQAQAPTPVPPVPTPTLLPDAPPNPYYDLLPQYFPNEQVNNASNVMFKESGFRPDAVNLNDDGSRDYGLFQINSVHEQDLKNKGMTLQDMLDVVKNIQYAAEMQKAQGWEPWYGADSLGLTSRSN